MVELYRTNADNFRLFLELSGLVFETGRYFDAQAQEKKPASAPAALLAEFVSERRAQLVPPQQVLFAGPDDQPSLF